MYHGWFWPKFFVGFKKYHSIQLKKLPVKTFPVVGGASTWRRCGDSAWLVLVSAGLWLTSTTMGRNCIVYGCSNSQKKGYSLFGFPKDPKLRREWTLQVKRTRDCWRGPSEHSAVCSAHFSEDCFEEASLASKKLGLKIKQMLKPGAIPTIFPRPSAVKRLQPWSSRHAYEKREWARVC